MAPRSRLHKNRGLVPNLYEQDGYYTYRNPETRKTYGLGRNRATAINQAVEANNHVMKASVTLVDRITGRAGRTVADWCEVCTPNERLRYLKQGLGEYILERLTPLQINDWLDKWNDKPRMRQAMLATTKTVFREAISKGWISVNPAASLKTPTPDVKRERLTLQSFQAIYKHAEIPLKRAMEISLMTCARRENVLTVLRSDVHDGHLHIAHIKKGLPVRYPLSLHLAAVGWTLGDVLARCKTNVVSKYLIHHQRTVGMAKPGDRFRDKTIEQWFRDAREAAGITGENPPTFHEIRSLAIRLWHDAGHDSMRMAGHKTEQSHALYKDPRGIEWVTVG